MNLSELVEILRRTGIPIYHYNTKSFPNMPYLTYTEYSEKYSKSDNKIDDVIINVQLDLFTHKEDVNTKKRIRKLLNEASIPFKYLVFVENEEEDNAITYLHHIFDCEVFE